VADSHRILTSAARPTPESGANKGGNTKPGPHRKSSALAPAATRPAADTRQARKTSRRLATMIMLVGSHPRKPPDHPPLQRTARGRLTPGRGETTGAPFPTAARVPPRSPPEAPSLTPSRPSPGVTAAAGHHAVRNTTLAQTDNPGAAGSKAVGTSALLPRPLAGSGDHYQWRRETTILKRRIAVVITALQGLPDL
jgi:hypothetical protein